MNYPSYFFFFCEFCSFPANQRCFLHSKKLHVVTHLWLKDSIQKGKKLLEDEYNLKPDTLEDIDFNIEEGYVIQQFIHVNLDTSFESTFIIIWYAMLSIPLEK